MRAAAGLLASELHARADDFVLLLVDDCHAIAHSADGCALLEALLDYLPSHCHLILAGRQLRPVCSLPRLRMHRQAGWLDAHALRLTPEEVVQLLPAVGLPGLAVDQVAELHARSQGWPIAFLLLAWHTAAAPAGAADLQEQWAGEALGAGSGGLTVPEPPHGRAPGRLPLESQDLLFDYLANEVLAHQPTPVRSLLLAASVLPAFTVERCAALLGLPAGEVRGLLAAAAGQGLLALHQEPPEPDGRVARAWNPAPADNSGLDQAALGAAAAGAGHISYRYHDLLRDFCVAALRDQQPARHRCLQRPAAQLAEAAGERDAAIAHAVAGRHWSRAARLIGAAGPTCIAAVRWHTLQTWLSALPDPLLDAHPPLLLLAIQCEQTMSSDYARAEALLGRARVALAGDTLGQIELLLVEKLVMARRGQYREAADLCREALRRLPADAPERLRADVSCQL